jgi:hypothetical protein
VNNYRDIISISVLTEAFLISLAGYGSSDANERYESTFGPLNRVLTIANHSVVLINAPGLVDEDAKRLQSGQSVDGWKWPSGGAFDYISRVAPNRKPFFKNECHGRFLLTPL